MAQSTEDDGENENAIENKVKKIMTRINLNFAMDFIIFEI